MQVLHEAHRIINCGPLPLNYLFLLLLILFFLIAVLHLRCGVGLSLLAASRGYSLGAVCRLSLVVERGF